MILLMTKSAPKILFQEQCFSADPHQVYAAASGASWSFGSVGNVSLDTMSSQQ